MSSSSIPRSVVITGAGSGLGRELAILFSERGYTVFGTATRAAQVSELSEATAGRVRLSVVDIADEAAVRGFVDAVSVSLGDAGLDVLISNAGILTPGPLEVLPISAIRHEFNVNVFGSLAVINGFLPALRGAKGRVLQLSSITAFFPLPFNGPSSASKAALEAFADVYRAELATCGVDFVMVIPGNMVTGGPAKTKAALQQVADSLTPEQQDLYGDPFAAFSEFMNAGQAGGLPAREAAERVIELAEQVPAPIRVAVGSDAEQILPMVKVTPDADLDAMRLQMIGLAHSPDAGADPVLTTALVGVPGAEEL